MKSEDRRRDGVPKHICVFDVIAAKPIFGTGRRQFGDARLLWSGQIGGFPADKNLTIAAAPCGLSFRFGRAANGGQVS